MLSLLVGIFVLGVLIFVHELGHFLLAKWNGVGVLEFSIGFGKKIWKRQIGETVYAIGAIPLGGYVRMVGDDPRLLDPAADRPALSNELLEGRDSLDGGETERKLLADPSRWFLGKPFWPKFAIVIAGPLFNVLFAIILAFVSILIYGDFSDVVDKPVIGSVVRTFPADRAGIKKGDYVRSIDGVEMKSWEQLSKTIAESAGKEMTLQVLRAEEGTKEPQELEFKLRGTFDTAEITALDEKKEVKPRAMVGIGASFEKKEVGIGHAVKAAPMRVWRITVLSLRSIIAMIRGDISTKSIGGPIFIFGEAARSAEGGASDLIDFMILLSVSLAVFNLLPMPVLDGGHILFFIIEAIRGKPVSLRVQQYATQFGMIVLLGLMLFAISNDILRPWRG